MNPGLRELLAWLRCPHGATMQATNDDHIAWRCDDCGLSRVKWLPTKYRDA